MPELRFSIRWPDGIAETCYSPSTVVRDHFLAGSQYPVSEFVARSRTALTAASERVKARYGSSCSLALGQLIRIETRAAEFDADAIVEFKTFEE